MIYVMSDIHGNRERFDSIMKQIHLQSSDTLYILGDVIDRYPDGIQILEEIMDKFNIKMLLGNHEYMMLCSLDSCFASYMDGHRWHNQRLWYRNGGKVTHEKWNQLEVVIQDKILTYLRSLPINIDISVNGKAYLLVHASPLQWYDPYCHYMYSDEIEFAVWERIVTKPKECDKMIVFGHTTTNHYQNNKPMCVFRHEQLIGVDCGSGYPKEIPEGRLACMRLDDGAIFYSEL